MKKTFYFLLFLLIFICIPFSLKLFDSVEAKKKSNKKTENISLQKEGVVSKKAPKIKYAIFDVCQAFWKKSLYDLIHSFQKERGGVRFSYYFKIVRYGVAYGLGTLDPKKAYEDFLSFCKGSSEQEIKKYSTIIWEKECKNFIFKEAKKIFEECKKKGMKIILAEAGMKELYADFLKSYSFDYVCTSELEFKDGVVTGKLIGEPCSGQEKLRKVKEIIEKKLGGSLKEAVFYANSHNDIPLLNEVGKPIVVNPTSKLSQYAKKKKWPILKFKEVIK
jgi:HAD superfamily hydrolase (TIGR01490 family)